MRFLLKVTIPAEGGNAALKSGALMEIVGNVIANYNVESSYFISEGGNRTCLLGLQLDDVTDIPSLAEPFWMAANAQVDLVPAMNWQDLQAGVGKFKATM